MLKSKCGLFNMLDREQEELTLLLFMLHMHTQGVSNSALPLVMRSTRVIQIFVITYTSLL